MKRANSSRILFEITQPHERQVMQELHEYLDWMFFAN